MSEPPMRIKSKHWKLRAEIAESCEGHAAKLRLTQGEPVIHLHSATIADLIITLERAAAGLR